MKNQTLLLLAIAFAASYAQAQCGSPGYTDPQFTIAIQNPACPLSGQITVVNPSDGVAPYTFTLQPGNISNSTGFFPNLVPGTYIVQMKDACGNIRARQGTITPYNFTTTSAIAPLGCNQFQFSIGCSATGPALEYGYALNGDSVITWGNSNPLFLTLSPQTVVGLYVKDSCGNEAVSYQTITEEMGGYIKQLKERIKCNGQEIYPEFYGFDEPKVCLYLSPQNTLVECKQAPAGNYNGGAATNFLDLPFGQDYYVIVEDGCYRDSAFFKDKTSVGGSELNPFAWHCTTFDLHSDGNNTDSVCLYNATTNQLVSCKLNDTASINPNTGLPWPYGGAEWYGLPYGTYYSYIYDPCEDTLVRIDTTVRYPLNFSTQLNFACNVNQSAVSSHFGPESPAPHTTTIYYPDNSVAASYTDAGWYLLYPTWPSPGTITVIQQDGCGYKDTSYLNQPMILPTRTVTSTGGCPGVNGSSGGGTIFLNGSALAYGGRGNGAPVATVTIIKKDSVPVTIPQTYTQWNNASQKQEYYFTNLTTGIYILESTIGCTGYKIYDTITVLPYVYPLQEQTYIVQCGANPFVFRDTITGGVSPYIYEVIGTNPSTPSLLTGPQANNIFSIPPGNNLTTITIQVIDACGNSHTKVFPVSQAACYALPTDLPDKTEILRKKFIKVYPNPSSKAFVIAFSQQKNIDYEVSIYNVTGIKLFTNLYKNVDTKTIAVTDYLTPGTYFITITDLNNHQKLYYKQVVL